MSSETITPNAYVTGTSSAFATSVTIPAHRPGDYIVMYSRTSGNMNTPTPPAASGTVPSWIFTGAFSTGDGNWAQSRVHYCIATTSTHTSGTWTGSITGMAVAVVRRATSIGPFAKAYQTATPWSAPTVTLTKTSGTSVVLHFFGWGDGINTVPASISTAPAGYTQQFTRTGTASTVALSLLTKNVTGSAPAVSLTSDARNTYGTHITIEIVGA
jgi:hypothetical protein